MAPAESLQPVETPHCQEPPPIFGPLPRSGGGRNSASLPKALRVSVATQLPLYRIAVLPLMKSLAGSAPDFSGAYLSVTRLRNHLAQSTACWPLSTPSADL